MLAQLKVWLLNLAVAFVCYFWVHSNLLGADFHYSAEIAHRKERLPTPQMAALSADDVKEHDRYSWHLTHHYGLMIGVGTESTSLGIYGQAIGLNNSEMGAPDEGETVDGYQTQSYESFRRWAAGLELSLLTTPAKWRSSMTIRLGAGIARPIIANAYDEADDFQRPKFTSRNVDVAFGLLRQSGAGRAKIGVDLGCSWTRFQLEATTFESRDAQGAKVNVPVAKQTFADGLAPYVALTMFQ